MVSSAQPARTRSEKARGSRWTSTPSRTACRSFRSFACGVLHLRVPDRSGRRDRLYERDIPLAVVLRREALRRVGQLPAVVVRIQIPAPLERVVAVHDKVIRGHVALLWDG